MGHHRTSTAVVRGRRSVFVLVAAVLVAAAVAAGCGGSSSPAPTVTATVTTAASPVASPTPSASATTATTGKGADATEPSPTIMALQSDLKKQGYYKGKLTGVYDAGTKAAVKRMEIALKVKNPDANYSPADYQAQVKKHIQGMTTQFIMQVQVAMQQLGYYKGNIDGVYGQKTVDAVKAFQASVGLPADGVAGPQTIAAYEAKIKGDSTVAALQQQLKDWGFYNGPITGVYGPLTVAAVKKLQVAYGVSPADGRWGPKTQAAVIAHHKSGKSTALTLQIQSDLATLGYYKGALDGVYGAGTTAAVKAFQSDHGLTPDGVAGSATINAINQAMRFGG